jgi:hypothetical protein
MKFVVVLYNFYIILSSTSTSYLLGKLKVNKPVKLPNTYSSLNLQRRFQSLRSSSLSFNHDNQWSDGESNTDTHTKIYSSLYTDHSFQLQTTSNHIPMIHSQSKHSELFSKLFIYCFVSSNLHKFKLAQASELKSDEFQVDILSDYLGSY